MGFLIRFLITFETLSCPFSFLIFFSEKLEEVSQLEEVYGMENERKIQILKSGIHPIFSYENFLKKNTEYLDSIKKKIIKIELFFL